MIKILHLHSDNIYAMEFNIQYFKKSCKWAIHKDPVFLEIAGIFLEVFCK